MTAARVGNVSCVACGVRGRPNAGVSSVTSLSLLYSEAAMEEHCGKGFREVSQIEERFIPESSWVVFDWDNTLKLIQYDATKKSRELVSRVSRDFLMRLKEKLRCQLFVISAIRPSRTNMESLLIEMDRLGLTDVFIRDGDKTEAHSNYVRKGHVMICGYDKAERFLDVFRKDEKAPNTVDGIDGNGGPVVFFDDELVNVTNFSALVPNSKCYHVIS